ncbi:MAG: TRAM domain-containing protein, partial [Clostridia bacterium]|nr:TRAM domain-containing protein [Clostridia bacterium]
KSKTEGLLSGRTGGNVIIEFMGDESLIGSFASVKVTNPKTWVVYGEYLG